MGDRDVGLDELFEVAPAPKEKRRSRPFGRRWWVRRVIAAVIVSGGIFVVFYVIRVGLPFLLMVATVLAVMVVHGALALVQDDPLPPDVSGRGVHVTVDDNLRGSLEGLRHSVAPTDGARYAINRWEDRLSWGERDGSRFASIVLPRLADLIDERLRQRHGFTAKADPERARAVLGEDLWRFMTQVSTRAATPRDVASIIAMVEGL
jgi:hypothetical protein